MKEFIHSPNFDEGSLLLINKPLHWTSFDVVNKIRYALKKYYPRIKVGHAGTLDPLATGLLIVCTGKLTKQIDSIQTQDKTYTGTFHLGATTPSYDLETEIDQHFETNHLNEVLIKQATAPFIGDIMQVPPIFSAIKKDGRAAYKSARLGEALVLDARQVHLSSFDITAASNVENIAFEVSCSKGTYIRSLVHDFGKSLQSGAFLTSLVRTKIGDYDLENSFEIEEMINFIHACEANHESI